MISSLLYLSANRLDIMFSVCICVRFQPNPKESHLIMVKGIVGYLVGTPCIALWYPKASFRYLIGYSNIDFVESWID